MIHRLFRRPAQDLSRCLGNIFPVDTINTEWCFYIETSQQLDQSQTDILWWLLAETYEPANLSIHSYLGSAKSVIEVGPRLNFETAFSTTAVKICHDSGIPTVTRLEKSLRVGFHEILGDDLIHKLQNTLHDRMTEQVYITPLSTFEHGLQRKSVRIIPLVEQGIESIIAINCELGLAMDKQDLEWVFHFFVNVLRRNPTDVELMQLGQANSEHCRHGFFKAIQFIDGVQMPESLFGIVKAPYLARPNNSVIAFHDDSSAISGLGPIEYLTPLVPDGHHLAMMPHPERTFQMRQWPWIPNNFMKTKVSPWLRMFQNAYDWCEAH